MYNKINNMFVTDKAFNKFFKELKADPSINPDFKINGKDLIFTPLNIKIIKKKDINKTLTQLFKTDSNTYSKGINSLYKYIRTLYGNITRDEVKSFLQTQPMYQLTKRDNSKLNRPIIAKYPNELWCVDLIDMNEYKSQNKQYRYIFNCVDVFSRKCWLKALKNKTPTDTTDALQEIINEANIKCKTLLADNGTEFEADFKTFCNNNGIKLIHTDSHSPTQNGVVERLNQDIRKILNFIFIENHNTVWYNILDVVAENKNNAFNSNIKGIPNQLWTDTNTALTKRTLPKSLTRNNVKLTNVVNQMDRATKAVEDYKEHFEELKVNSAVRVKMATIFSNYRKEVKAGNSKNLKFQYTPQIFHIAKIIKSRKPSTQPRFVLVNSNGYALSENGKIKFFKSDDLQLVNKNSASNYTMEDALRLDGIKTNMNDVDY